MISAVDIGRIEWNEWSSWSQEEAHLLYLALHLYLHLILRGDWYPERNWFQVLIAFMSGKSISLSSRPSAALVLSL